MSSFKKKYNEIEMNNMLSQLLYPDESIVVAVYCVFLNNTFLRYNSTSTGYIGVTDKKRLVGYKFQLVSDEGILKNLNDLKKIKIKKNIFGQYNVKTTFEDYKKEKIIFQMSKKVVGNKFPNQEENVDKIISVLSSYINL
ncbi:MAG: hypothetical protein IIX48_06700 [Lachnospiraceae bacterium]|nr:hypothetical protein [Lachnospiraceae bacterium]